MSVLRAGVVGAGVMGRNHARVLSSIDDAQLVAVVDPVVEGTIAGAPVVPDVAALIRLGVDMAVVAAPTVFHESVACELADAGVHVLVEKPVATDSAAARRIAEACGRAGVVGAVGHIERYNPAVLELRRRLDDDQLGELFQITTRRQGPFPARISDVGVIFDLATHDIDLTTFVTGRPFTSVVARTAHKSGREHEDLVAALGWLDGGLVSSHLVNWLMPTKERVTVVVGERGCFVADTLQGDLTFYENGILPVEWDVAAVFRGVSEGNMTRFAIQKREPLRSELEAFISAVRGEKAEIVTLEQGTGTVAVAEAMLASSRSSSVVAVANDAAAG